MSHLLTYFHKDLKTYLPFMFYFDKNNHDLDLISAIEYFHGRVIRKEIFLQKDYFKYKCYVNIHYNRSNKSNKRLEGYIFCDLKLGKNMNFRDKGVLYSITLK